jgi:hypothetical protein
MQTPPPAAAPVESGPVVQAPPTDLPQPARVVAPILPPMQPPTTPSWKQELKEPEPATPAAEASPEPEKSNE